MTMKLPVVNQPETVLLEEEAPKSILDEILEVAMEVDVAEKIVSMVDDDPILRRLVQWVEANRKYRTLQDEYRENFFADYDWVKSERGVAMLKELDVLLNNMSNLRPDFSGGYSVRLSDGRVAQVRCACGAFGACDMRGGGGYSIY
jgi:hypothetical protein